MRRPLVALTVLSCLGLVACEDGPTQTFAPAPSGAGSQWNDGQSTPVVAPTMQGFGTQGGGNNLMQICTGSQEAARWAVMVKQPIIPPIGGGGLDLSGTNWAGLTIEQAEQINCQSTSAGDQFGDGSAVNYWGDNGEVWVDYNVSSHKIYFATFWPGYVGSINMMSRDGKNSYSLFINQQSTKNGNPYQIDWLDPVKLPAEVNELYDALTATFAPGLPVDPACTQSGTCIVGNFGDVAYMYFPAMGTGLWVPTRSGAQPAPSIFNRIDQYLAKTLPYSLAGVLLKLDPTGPVGIGGLLGANTGSNQCNVQMGQTYDQFNKTCVSVTGDAAKDQTEVNKLLGGITHGDESWTFDVSGVDINFQDLEIPANDVVHDNNLPVADDPAVSWDADQSTLGNFLNDRVGNVAAGAKDLHGSGYVYLEYARLVQAGLNQYLPAGMQHQLGDAACLYDPVAMTGVNPATLNFPAGCTGFEGFVTTAPQGSTTVTGLNKLTSGTFVSNNINPNMAIGLKPGHPASAFCLDANGDFSATTAGYQLCNGGPGAQGDLFATSFARVVQVLGGGQVFNVPVDAQDVRFYWKQYFTALVKYLKVAGTANETPDGVHAAVVDIDDMFFDSIGAGQFEIGEYVDRTYASKTIPPTDLNVTCDVKNGIFNDFSFSRELYRGETAIYTALLENQADGIGQEHSALLTNVFGSPLLLAGWTAVPNYTAYQCATGNWSNTAAPQHVDPNVVLACGGQLVPMVDPTSGLPVPATTPGAIPRFLRYQGAFSSTPFSLGPTQIKVLQTFDSIQQAMISIPLTTNPYDPNSAQLAPLSVLVPWAPQQPGIGFPIALTGTLDKFVETSQLDLSGTTITANIDYTPVIDPKTLQPMTDGSIQFDAVETTDFLGEVYVCQDANSGDLLGVRMYTPVATILNWFASHPGSEAACGIIVRYSPYGNYADYITSLTNGVRLNITQGGGFGRVVDVTLFVPGQ